MLVSVKVTLIMFAVVGIATTGVHAMPTEPPMSKAIEIHEDHLGADSTLPEKAIKGQQTAYDHLMKNFERWALKNHTWTDGGYLQD